MGRPPIPPVAPAGGGHMAFADRMREKQRLWGCCPLEDAAIFAYNPLDGGRL